MAGKGKTGTVRMAAMALAVSAIQTLTGCGDGGSTARDQAVRKPQAGDVLADCAIGPSGPWARDCLVERDGDLLTLRHPDGGFRRLRIVSDGHGLAAADGAEQAKLVIVGDRRIEVTVGTDRYRLPATVAAGGR